MSTKDSAIAKRPKRRPSRSAAEHCNPKANGQSQLTVGHHLASAYHEQIAELESTVTTLRERLRLENAKSYEFTEKQRHFCALFQDAPAPYLVHNRAGAISDFNKAASRLLQMNQARPLGHAVPHFLEPGDLALWLEHMYKCAHNLRASTCLRLRPRSGQLLPVQVESAAVPGTLGHPAKTFLTIITDVRQHAAAEEELRQTQAGYHLLIDTIEGIVWEADARTLDFTFVSGYAERLLGYPLAEWRRPGFWLNRLYAEDRERVANALARAVAKREELRLDYRVQTADRRLVWLHDNISLLERDGQLRLLGVAVDATHRHEIEEQLRRTNETLEQRVLERTVALRETVRELEAFSYSLSHDMRSPIRAMQGYASLLERMAGDKLGRHGMDFLRRIMHSAERLDLLVQDVLNYSRVARAPVNLHRLPLDGVVDSILHDYPTLAPRKARIEVSQPLLPVIGHEAFVAQALSNLLTNAVKFMPPGRKPRVRLWTEPVQRADASADWVRICVQDNGVGIAQEDQQRIFHMFERIYPTDKYEGTGIGLAIVQKAVERMGGRVGLESAPGQGSRFWIELRQPQGEARVTT